MMSVSINGVDLHFDPAGVAFWPDRSTLLVADLHLEKGTSYGRFGTTLPPYDSRTTLRRLGQVLARLKPGTVICLGDSFHDREAGERLPLEDRIQLNRLVDGHDWIWITGNHDPDLPQGLGGMVTAEHREGPLVFRHEAQPQAGSGEISGHYHPKAAVAARGRRLSGKCFLEDGQRLIMPSFGAYTGGLSVRDPAYEGLFGRNARAHLIGRQSVHCFPLSRVLPERLASAG